MLRSIAVLLASLSLGATATAAEPKALSPEDMEFVTEAAQSGLLEVELGTIATQRAVQPQVKKFGEQMVTDHSKVNQQLMAVAEQKGVTVPAALDKKSKKTVERMQKLEAAEFDREYLKLMVKEHEKDVKAFSKYAKAGKDADLKSFAQTTLPALEEHLTMARRLETQAKGIGGSGEEQRSPEGAPYHYPGDTHPSPERSK